MSVKVMARVWAYSRQSGGSLLLMLALADFADDAGECWPSIPVLAQKARLTEREIRYLLPKLEEAGEVQLKRSNGGRNRRNRYLVTVTENPESISVKNIQGNSFSEICDIKTLKPISGALNRHRTVNKNIEPTSSPVLPHSKKRKLPAPDPVALAAQHQRCQDCSLNMERQLTLDAGEDWLCPKCGRRFPIINSDRLIPNSSFPIPKEKRNASRPDIPPELQPAVSRIVAKINELGATHYKDDKPDALRNLLARLREGRTEAECLAVVEGRHAAWAGNDKMLEYFRPSTLFAAAHFDDYLQAAQKNGNGHTKPAQVKDLGNGMIEIDGRQMDRATYERRYGQQATA